MSKRSEAVKRWRERTKFRIIESMGGACCICGYKKYFVAMELHHIDPSQKELSFGNVTSNPAAWSKIVKELRKCILLCSNCHKGVHHGLVNLPAEYPQFDETFVNKNNDINSYVKAELMDECPVCKTLKPIVYKTCSKGCASKLARKIDWNVVDLRKMQNDGLSDSAIGRTIGVSGGAVRKRINKLQRDNVRFCPFCNSEFNFNNSNQKYCSKKCSRLASRKCIHPSQEQLEEDIANLSWVAIGEKYGVSDKACKKWAIKYGLIV